MLDQEYNEILIRIVNLDYKKVQELIFKDDCGYRKLQSSRKNEPLTKDRLVDSLTQNKYFFLEVFVKLDRKSRILDFFVLKVYQDNAERSDLNNTRALLLETATYVGEFYIEWMQNI